MPTGNLFGFDAMCRVTWSLDSDLTELFDFKNVLGHWCFTWKTDKWDLCWASSTRDIVVSCPGEEGRRQRGTRRSITPVELT